MRNGRIIIMALLLLFGVAACSPGGERSIEVGTSTENESTIPALRYESQLYDIRVDAIIGWRIAGEPIIDGEREEVRFEPVMQTVPAQYVEVVLEPNAGQAPDEIRQFHDNVWTLRTVRVIDDGTREVRVVYTAHLIGTEEMPISVDAADMQLSPDGGADPSDLNDPTRGLRGKELGFEMEEDDDGEEEGPQLETRSTPVPVPPPGVRGGGLRGGLPEDVDGMAVDRLPQETVEIGEGIEVVIPPRHEDDEDD